jgi:hypothetical protein
MTRTLHSGDQGVRTPIVRSSTPRILLWSRSPWSAVDRVGDEVLPGDRCVSGVTQ